MGLKDEIPGSLGVCARIEKLCLDKEVDMKKLIACSLACLMTVSANATNWLEVASYNQDGRFYVDTDSMDITSKEYKMITAFFKTNKLDGKFNGKTVYSSRQQWSINCRNRSFSILSILYYDLNGRVIDKYDMNRPEIVGDSTF